jgi:hypothetical protein
MLMMMTCTDSDARCTGLRRGDGGRICSSVHVLQQLPAFTSREQLWKNYIQRYLDTKRLDSSALFRNSAQYENKNMRSPVWRINEHLICRFGFGDEFEVGKIF